MRRCLLLSVLAGCFAADDESEPDGWLKTEEGDKAALNCGYETLDLFGGTISSNVPFMNSQRLYESKKICWDITANVDPEEETAVVDWERTADAGPPVLGCGFHGTGTERGVTFTSGSCVLPSETGHYRLTLNEPFEMRLPEYSELTMLFDYQEVRGDDLVVGKGRIFFGLGPGGLGVEPDHVYAKQGPPVGNVVTDPNASCRMPACSTANLAGKGTLVSGNTTICNDLLASYATPFNVYFNDKNQMAFAADAPEAERFPVVLDKATCGVRTWGGEEPHPVRLWHLDANGVFTLDETVLHTSGQLSDVCTLHWETTVTGC